MIFVVDDEAGVRDAAADALEAAGFSTHRFADARQALDAAGSVDPECVVTDLSMPEMDGFAFFQEYQFRHASRQTPFIFLTGHADDANVVRALEMGAQDYLVKPVSPAVLAARVRAVLSRRKRHAAFVGDLSRISMVRILQFVETKGIFGTLEVEAPEGTVRLRLRAGEVDEADMERLDRVFDASSGRFSIHVDPVDFAGIAEAAAPAPGPVLREKPMGQLSGVHVLGKLFQVQTEFTERPAPAYTTVVMVDGRTVAKKSTPADLSLSRSAMEEAMAAQHRAMEAEIRRKTALPEPSGEPESPMQRYSRLLDEGYEHLREKRYESALAAWQEAARLDPENRTLQLNLEILRKKMQSSNPST